MGEFGHIYHNSPGLHVDAWGSGPFIIKVGDREFRFEDSDRFGPVILNKDDLPAERQPSERSPFWRAHGLWRRQGRRLAEDGKTCVYGLPEPTLVERIDGKNVRVVSQGDEDGEVIVLGKAG